MLSAVRVPAESKKSIIKRDLVRNRYIYLMLVPVLIYYAIFHYGPMYGLLIAFKDYSIADGVWQSPWVGFTHFQIFLKTLTFGDCFETP